MPTPTADGSQSSDGEAARTVAVRLGGGASYAATYGYGIWPRLNDLLPAGSAVVVISDDRVWSLWGEALCRALGGEEPPASYTFAAGEASKIRETKAALEDQLLAHGWGRDLVILALGGGVTTDLAGFVAATYLRGVPWIALPTTLLGMVDASLGGKTGVDLPAGKNLVGAFHQPLAVLAELESLGTLPTEALADGLAESVKHAALDDADFLAWLEAEADAIRRLEPAVVLHLVERSAGIKARYVAADTKDQGRRQLLNYGHTVGHAIEQVSAYGITHGNAVAMGMMVETAAGALAGRLPAEQVTALAASLQALGLPTKVPAALDRGALWAAMGRDKKRLGGELRFALPASLGCAPGPDVEATTPLPEDAVNAALSAWTE